MSNNAFIKDYRNPKATLPLAAHSSNHGQPNERFDNMAMHRLRLVIEKGLLPESRAKNCRYEFHVLRFAFQKGIAPHIDMKIAAKVLAMAWLACALAPRRLR